MSIYKPKFNLQVENIPSLFTEKDKWTSSIYNISGPKANPEKITLSLSSKDTSSFDNVVSACKETGNMPTFISDNTLPIAVVRFNKCIDEETKKVDESVLNVIRRLGTYAEITPKGDVCAYFIDNQFKGKISNKKDDNVKFYYAKGNFEMTGNMISGSPDDVATLDGHLQTLIETLHETKSDEAAQVKSINHVENAEVKVATTPKPQLVENLPDEIVEQPRAFGSKGKVPRTKGWQKPENQSFIKKVLEEYDTFGYDINGNGRGSDYVFMDFDHIIIGESNELVSEKAKMFVELLVKTGTYMEFSISKTGLHVLLNPTPGRFDVMNYYNTTALFIADDEDKDKKECAKVEIFYKTPRNCYFTGYVYRCSPKTPIISGEEADKVIQVILDMLKEQQAKMALNKKSKKKKTKHNLKPSHSSVQFPKDYDYNLTRVQAMLHLIPANEYDVWIKVGMVLYNEGFPFELWDNWSRSAPDKYNEARPDDCEYTWNSLGTSDSENKLRMGTLVEIAEQYGYNESQFRKQYLEQKRRRLCDDPYMLPETVEEVKELLDKNQEDKVKNHLSNIRDILKYDPILRNRFIYNEFSHRFDCKGSRPWCNSSYMSSHWCDRDEAETLVYISDNYGIVPTVKNFHTALSVVVYSESVHPIKEFFKELEEEYFPELETLTDSERYQHAETIFVKALETRDYDYTRTVTMLWLMGCINRILNPGCQFDFVLLFKGNQGIGKSSIIRKLAVKQEWYLRQTKIDGKDALLALQGKWLVDLDEMNATRKSEVEAIKGFISATVDSFRMPYGYNYEDYPRQCVFAGTTNDDKILRDHTGGRRFLILECNAAEDNYQSFQRLSAIDEEYIRRVWAEAYYAYNEKLKGDGKINLVLSSEMEAEARRLQELNTEGDEFIAKIDAFLDRKIPRPDIWNRFSPKQRRKWFEDSGLIDTDTQRGDGEVLRQFVSPVEILNECEGTYDTCKNQAKLKLITAALRKLPNWKPYSGASKTIPGYGRQTTVFERVVASF